MSQNDEFTPEERRALRIAGEVEAETPNFDGMERIDVAVVRAIRLVRERDPSSADGVFSEEERAELIEIISGIPLVDSES